MKIAVIGLGLIGGSIFKRLQKEQYDVIGISHSQRGNNIFNDYSFLNNCDIVFVCTPMNKTIETLNNITEYVHSKTIVTDVCSLKTFLTQKSYPFKYIPSHPMAGTEFSGYENSSESMFEGAKWVITAKEQNNDTHILETLIKAMGASPIYTTPEAHDEAVAMISHVPMLVAQGLFETASNNHLAMKLASSGFRDSTRLAGSNPEMAIDMINLNHTNIQSSLLKLYANIGKLLENYETKHLQNLANTRKEMYKDGKNIL